MKLNALLTQITIHSDWIINRFTKLHHYHLHQRMCWYCGGEDNKVLMLQLITVVRNTWSDGGNKGNPISSPIAQSNLLQQIIHTVSFPSHKARSSFRWSKIINFGTRLVPVLGGPKIVEKGQSVCQSSGFFLKFCRRFQYIFYVLTVGKHV